MKFLVLAYGSEEGWLALPESRRAELLAQDDVLRARGDLVAIAGDPCVVRSRGGTTTTSGQPFATGPAPLAGMGLIEAADLDEAVALVAQTPCAVAGGAVELRALSGL